MRRKVVRKTIRAPAEHPTVWQKLEDEVRAVIGLGAEARAIEPADLNRCVYTYVYACAYTHPLSIRRLAFTYALERGLGMQLQCRPMNKMLSHD